MIVASASFLLAGLRIIQEPGLGLAGGVLVDAGSSAAPSSLR
ncbi:MAG: hypothetical protein ACRDNW_03440 [Trebonia sp.]